jgi:hypothetical protein
MGITMPFKPFEKGHKVARRHLTKPRPRYRYGLKDLAAALGISYEYAKLLIKRKKFKTADLRSVIDFAVSRALRPYEPKVKKTELPPDSPPVECPKVVLKTK